MARKIGLLILGAAIFWVLTGLPVKWVTGDEKTLVLSGAAMLLCLVPGVLTLVWAHFATDGDQQTLMVLGSTGLRLFGVLAAALFLYWTVPPFEGSLAFLLWLVVDYLFTLAVELFLLLHPRSAT